MKLTRKTKHSKNFNAFKDATGRPNGAVDPIKILERQYKSSKSQQSTGLAIEIAKRCATAEKYERAVSWLEKAYKINSNPITLIHIASTYRDHLDDPYTAIEYFEKAAEQEPSPTCLHSLGNLYSDTGQSDKAMKSYEKAHALLASNTNDSNIHDKQLLSMRISAGIGRIKRDKERLQPIAKSSDTNDLDM